MGETRHPALGSWSVFEGDVFKTGKEEALPWGGDVNEPIEWPVTLRVFYIRDGVMSSRDIVVDEHLMVEVGERFEASTRSDESPVLPPEAVSASRGTEA